MYAYLFIGLGGALGAIARVLLSKMLPGSILKIPARILLINIIGCFVLGIITGFMTFFWSASLNTRHFLIQGFLGGFTTFSAFALEFGLLYEKGNNIIAIAYVILSVVLSIFFFFLGLKIFKIFA